MPLAEPVHGGASSEEAEVTATTRDESANRYLTGNYAPVADELTALDLAVTGELPAELDGRYLRIGPNPVTAPEPETYHWFTGDGMVHGIRLRGGRAEWYRNRWVRSADVATALGEEPKGGPVHAGMDFAPNTNVIGHSGRTLALVEAGALPYELTEELETVGPTDFDGTLTGGYTAHPKRDPATGELHAISYFWGWGNKVQYSVTGTDGRVRRAVDVEVGGPVSVHDLSITERYAVVYDLPVVFSIEAAMSGAKFPYRWDPDYQARIGLLPHEGSADEMKWFEIEPCYVFHPLNAYDDGDSVVLDVIRHTRMFATELLGPDEGPPSLERWTVDTAAGKVIEERLDDLGQEFPRVDERLVGRRHRFGYAGGFLGEESWLIKHDLVRGAREIRPVDAAGGSAEAVFVPRHADAGEDDGWVMALVYDATRDSSDLLVLNAADFTGEPAAVVHLPQRVPFGFHGNWVPATD
jgi:carotenoid cleavage dioxygenase